jgi:hypothetical protein
LCTLSSVFLSPCPTQFLVHLFLSPQLFFYVFSQLLHATLSLNV